MIQLDDLRQLLQQGDDHTLTLYLAVDPAARENQAAPPAWRIWLRDALKAIEDALDGDHIWRDIRARAEGYFAEFRPNSKSVALFTSPDFQQVFELPVPVENQAAFGKPPIAPLLWAMHEYRSYLIVMVDQRRASFYTAYLGQVGFQHDMKLELDTHDWREMTGAQPSSATPSLGRGSSEDDFVDRLEEDVRGFHRQVVEQIKEFMEKQGIRRLALGGSEQSANSVREMLPEHIANVVVGVLPIPMRCSPPEIMQRVQPRALAHEREQELELVRQVIDLAKAGGRGALGRQAVMQALEQQRVELLLAAWPLPDQESFQDVTAQAFASSATIELVHGEAAERLEAEGGLGARLYYAL